jgi:hypothetical protein
VFFIFLGVEMKIMKTKLFFGWGMIFLCWLFPSVGKGEGDFIVVGCPMPAGASYGINGVRGLTLAAEEINAAGGILIGARSV